MLNITTANTAAFIDLAFSSIQKRVPSVTHGPITEMVKHPPTRENLLLPPFAADFNADDLFL
jgi:hypothetical protein